MEEEEEEEDEGGGRCPTCGLLFFSVVYRRGITRFVAYARV